MMRHVPAIPESTRSSIIVRLLDHADASWPQLAKVQARYHGPFASITGVLPGGRDSVNRTVPCVKPEASGQIVTCPFQASHPSQ